MTPTSSEGGVGPTKARSWSPSVYVYHLFEEGEAPIYLR